MGGVRGTRGVGGARGVTALVIAVTVAMGTLASTATAFAPNPGYGSMLVTRHADADAGLKRSVVTYGVGEIMG